MKHILRSEYEYMKGSIGFGFAIIGTILLANLFLSPILNWNSFDNLLQIRQLFWKDLNIYLMMFSTTIGYFILLLVLGTEIDKEKRERMQVMLPVSLKEISIVRMLLPIVLQFCMVGLWIVLAILKPGSEGAALYWTMLFANGYILFISYLFYIYHDLGYYHTPKYRVILFAILLFAAMVILSIYYKSFQGSLSDFITTLVTSPEGAFIASIAGLAILFPGFSIFIKRKAFLA